MKKIVVLGVLGTSGHIMAEYLDSIADYKVYGIARGEGLYVTKQIDVLDFAAVESYLNAIKPDVVINCLGMLVQQANNDISTAILINSYLPHFLSELGNKIAYKLIHISTDCVFSGKDGPYQEDSFKDGEDNYARTKALGEIVNNKDLTIRTSYVGPELKSNGSGLLDWFLKQTGETTGYTQAYWSGVTTLELAKATDQLIKQNITGLYHLCPEQKISKYDLLGLFANVWGKDITITPYDNNKVDKSLLCTRQDFTYENVDYLPMLNELKQWMDNHPTYYANNY